MKLVVLGKYGPYAAEGGACSSYYLEQGQTRLLFECGNGALARLQSCCALEELSAIIISHWHSDHMSDLLILRYAISGLKARGLWNREPMTIYAPPIQGTDYEFLENEPGFSFVFLRDELKIEYPKLTIQFIPVTHPEYCFAMEFKSREKRLVYSGDTSMDEKLIPFAHNADLFLCDAGLLERDKGEHPPHLTATQAGLVAKMARARRLVLTHLFPRYTEEEILKEACLHYPEAEIASEMEIIEI